MKVVKKGETCKKSGEVSQRLTPKGPYICAKAFLNAAEAPEREPYGQTWVCKRSLWLQCGRGLEGGAWRQRDWLGDNLGRRQAGDLKGYVKVRDV